MNYKLTNDTVTQCFCSESGNGIQTNWWKASSLTNEQVKILESQGWYYVPNGNVWGLDSDAYVAKNNTYSCLPSDHSTDRGGQVNGATTGQILGLATTGNMATIVIIFTLATLFIFAGVTRLVKGLHHEKTN